MNQSSSVCTRETLRKVRPLRMVNDGNPHSLLLLPPSPTTKPTTEVMTFSSSSKNEDMSWLISKPNS
jgi:hypothetical protein